MEELRCRVDRMNQRAQNIFRVRLGRPTEEGCSVRRRLEQPPAVTAAANAVPTAVIADLYFSDDEADRSLADIAGDGEVLCLLATLVDDRVKRLEGNNAAEILKARVCV